MTEDIVFYLFFLIVPVIPFLLWKSNSNHSKLKQVTKNYLDLQNQCNTLEKASQKNQGEFEKYTKQQNEKENELEQSAHQIKSQYDQIVQLQLQNVQLVDKEKNLQKEIEKIKEETKKKYKKNLTEKEEHFQTELNKFKLREKEFHEKEQDNEKERKKWEEKLNEIKNKEKNFQENEDKMKNNLEEKEKTINDKLKQIQELEEKLNQKNETNSDKEKEIAKKNEELQEKSKQIEKKEQEIEEKTKKWEEKKKKFAEQETEASEKQKELEKKEEEIKQRDNDRENEKKELEKLREKINKKKDKLKKEKEENSEKQKEIEERKIQLEAEKQKIHEKEQEIEKILREIDEKKLEKQEKSKETAQNNEKREKEFEKRLKELEEREKSLLKREKHLENEKEKKKEDKTDKKSKEKEENEKLKKEQEKLEEEKKKIEKKKENLKEKVKKQEEKEKEQEEKQKELEKRLEQFEDEKRDAENVIHEYEEKQSTFFQLVENLQKQRDNFEAQTLSSTEKIQTKKQKVSTLKEENKKLLEKLAKIKSKKQSKDSQLTEQLGELQAELSNINQNDLTKYLETEFIELKNRCLRLEDENHKLREEQDIFIQENSITQQNLKEKIIKKKLKIKEKDRLIGEMKLEVSKEKSNYQSSRKKLLIAENELNQCRSSENLLSMVDKNFQARAKQLLAAKKSSSVVSSTFRKVISPRELEAPAPGPVEVSRELSLSNQPVGISELPSTEANESPESSRELVIEEKEPSIPDSIPSTDENASRPAVVPVVEIPSPVPIRMREQKLNDSFANLAYELQDEFDSTPNIESNLALSYTGLKLSEDPFDDDYQPDEEEFDIPAPITKNQVKDDSTAEEAPSHKGEALEIPPPIKVEEEPKKVDSGNEERVKKLDVDVLQAEIEQKRKQLSAKRTQILKEIYYTEENYVNLLKNICDNFVQPLRAAVNTENPILSEFEIRSIFSSVEVIKNYNSFFLEKLKERVDNWDEQQCLGDLFLEVCVWLKSYSNYVNNYGTALQTLNDVSKTKPFKRFIQSPRVKKHLNRQDLRSLLVAPVQRIPRYVLLLQDFVNNTCKDHPDYADLSLALDGIKKIAETVNAAKERHENIGKIFDYASRMDAHFQTQIVAPHRIFIADGILYRSASAVALDPSDVPIKDIFIVILFSDIVVLCRPEDHPFPKGETPLPMLIAERNTLKLKSATMLENFPCLLEVKRIFLMSQIEVLPIEKQKLGLKICEKSSSDLKLYAKTENQLSEWLNNFRTTKNILEAKEKLLPIIDNKKKRFSISYSLPTKKIFRKE